MAVWSRSRVYHSMFVPAWSNQELERSTPQGDRQITSQGLILLSASRDLAGAKKVAEAAAGVPLKWEECRALRAFSNALVRARGLRDGKDGWYLISRSR
jgi:hypothetical protein